MVGMADGVDHIADALRADTLGKIDDLARLRREGRVDKNTALRRHDQPCIHLDIEGGW